GDPGARTLDPIRGGLLRHLLEVVLHARLAVLAELLRRGDEVGRQVGIERRVQVCRQADVVVEAERLPTARAGALARVRVADAAGGLLDAEHLGAAGPHRGDRRRGRRDDDGPRDVTHADPPRLVSPRARPSGSCRYLWGSEPLPSIDIGGAATLGWHLLTWPLVVVAAVA